MLRLLIGAFAIAELVGFSQAILRVPLRHNVAKRSVSEGKQKRYFNAADGFQSFREQTPLHGSAESERKGVAVQPLKVTGSTFQKTMHGAEVQT